MKHIDLKKAKEIASTYDVSTPKDCAVVYSISFMETTLNRDKAYNFTKTNPQFKTLDDTPCGKALSEMGCCCTSDKLTEDLRKIWKTASERFIASASGDLKAFVEGADPRSTFCSIEMPAVLKNDNIITINGILKTEFLKNFCIKSI